MSIRLRPEYSNHVRSYDFVEDRTRNGRKYLMLNVVDEYTRECIAIRVNRRPRSTDVIDVLSDLFILRGIPGHVRSDNGPEFIARSVREWITAVGAKTAYIMPGSPRKNGYCESFNSKLRDELLNGEISYALQEAKVVIESWRRHYNTVRPHSSLGYKPPAPGGRAMAGFATGPSFAGHTGGGAKTNHELTSTPDHRPLGTLALDEGSVAGKFLAQLFLVLITGRLVGLKSS